MTPLAASVDGEWAIGVARAFAEARDYAELYDAVGSALAVVAPGAGYTILVVSPDASSSQVDRSTDAARGTAVEPGPELARIFLGGGGGSADELLLAAMGRGDTAAVRALLKEHARAWQAAGREDDLKRWLLWLRDEEAARRIGVPRSEFPVPRCVGLPPCGFAARLAYQGEGYGLFLVHPAGDERLDARRLGALAELLSARYVTVQLSEEESRQARSASERLAWISRLGEELSGGLQTEEMIPKIVGVVLELVGAQVATVVLKRGGRFEAQTEFGIPLSVVNALRMAGGEKLLADHVLETGETLIVPDPGSDPRVDFSAVKSHRIENLLAVPLVTRERRLGVLLLVNSPSRPPFPLEERVALPTLAGVASQALENSILHEEAVQLKIAQRIQQSLLPKDPPPRPGFEFAGWSQACDATGGDYYDFVAIDENRMGVVIGDVSGHGLGAALFMLTARAFLRSLLSTIEGIDQVFYRANNLLAADMSSEQFMTCFLGIIDSSTRQLLYTSAGHDAPFLYRRAVGEFADLDSTGFPLGIMSDSDFPTAEPVPLAPGDVLVFGTDGIWEAMNPNDEEYGRDRLCALVRDVSHQPGSGIIQAIRTDVLAFCAGREQRDDWTICVVKVVEGPTRPLIAEAP